MDWNLLSTASPAIDAWLNPSNRLALSVSTLISGYKRRITSVIACIMTDALDTPGMHFVFKVHVIRMSKTCSMSLELSYLCFSIDNGLYKGCCGNPPVTSCLKASEFINANLWHLIL